jgi:GntR family transcriptional regulator
VVIDRDSDVPVGVQLAWHLRARIAALQPGDRLPGVRDLAVQTGVNVNTVRSVYSRLEAEGLVASEHGRGTFVSDKAPADRRIAGIVERAAQEARDAGLDPREVAAALYVNREDDEQARRRSLRDEIATLERRLADTRPPESPELTVERPAGGRLLSLAELRDLRDDLAAKVRLLEDDARVAATEARARTTAASPSRSTAARVRWTPRTES